MATVQDWSNNIVGTYKFKDGKRYLLSNNSSSQSARSTCYYLNYYNCPPDYGGNFANCDYLGSELLGCGDETTIQCNGECGGNIVVGIDSIFSTSPKSYTVLGYEGYWKVEGLSILKGYKFLSYPFSNYFTELPAISSDLVIMNVNLPTPIYTKTYHIANWELANTRASTEFKGHVTSSLTNYDLIFSHNLWAAALHL